MIGRRSKPSIAKKVKRTVIGAGVLAAAGYVAGVLTAPKSGKQTRQDIRKRANNTMADAEKELKRAQTELDKTIKEAKATGNKASAKTKQEVNDVVERAKDARQKARELISAVREGEADDRDLKRAVKDANDALQHLKDFLTSKPKKTAPRRKSKTTSTRRATKK